MNKKIANVVFYKFWDPTREDAMQQACIFYEDGSVKNTTYDEGLEAAYIIANAEKLTGSQFRTMLNKDRVYTMSGTDFERRYQDFIKVSPENVSAAVNANMVKIMPTRNTVRTNENDTQRPIVASETIQQNNKVNQAEADEQARMAREVQRILRENRERLLEEPVQPVVTQKHSTPSGQTSVRYTNPTPVGLNSTNQSTPRRNNPNGHSSQNNFTSGNQRQGTPFVYPYNNQQSNQNSQFRQNNYNNPTRQSSQNNYGNPTRQSSPLGTNQFNAASNPTKKPSLWQRFKKSKVGKKVTALLVAGSILLGGVGGYHLAKNSKEGQIINNNIALQQMDKNNYGVQDAAYNKLLDKTKNKDLKAIMTKQGLNLDMYNRDFAADYIETGKDVKAALSWDEVIALNLAYNDYTMEQISLMFNGAEVDSLALSHAYKNAQLQLMGAYVISDRETPVNMAGFINDEEGQLFVQKYENLFYDCKEATGEARVAAVNKFYQELFKDFPINSDERELGLSHADSRNKVKNYMAAVAPMVAASEIMWQNLSIDHTLSDKATAYFNDIGLCNIAEDSFERAETITIAAKLDKSVPTYEEFMNTKINELMIEENYVIDDAHRDLSKLDAFQKWVNGYFAYDANGYNTGTITTTQSSYTKTTYDTKTTSQTTSDRNAAVNAAGEAAVKKAEDKVNKQIEKENAKNKEKAEKEAEKKRQELQNEADKDANKQKEEVAKDNQDFQNKVDDANDKINNGGTVNESDIGHGTDFDNDHSDSNGNLNDNVSDITSDGNGAVDKNDPLPDPNATGNNFDNQGGQTNSGSTTPETDYFDEDINSYEEPYQPTASNADIVDAMIRDMEANKFSNDNAKVYTKTA